MKKNKMMRTASVLLVAALMTTSMISGTFAKYTTESSGETTARVAKWGFENTDNQINITDLFSTTYGTSNTVKSSDNTTKVIAPGTSGSASFSFAYNTTSNSNIAAPEVAYAFTVDTSGSTVGENIKKNKDIVWKLDDTECTAAGNKTSWDVLLENIEKLSGDENPANNKGTKTYEAGNLPKAFYGANSADGAKRHTVSWEWKFSNDSNTYDSSMSQDQLDTSMGNSTTLETVKLSIKITATQVESTSTTAQA